MGADGRDSTARPFVKYCGGIKLVDDEACRAFLSVPGQQQKIENLKIPEILIILNISWFRHFWVETCYSVDRKSYEFSRQIWPSFPTL